MEWNSVAHADTERPATQQNDDPAVSVRHKDDAKYVPPWNIELSSRGCSTWNAVCLQMKCTAGDS